MFFHLVLPYGAAQLGETNSHAQRNSKPIPVPGSRNGNPFARREIPERNPKSKRMSEENRSPGEPFLHVASAGLSLSSGVRGRNRANNMGPKSRPVAAT